jgi:hypothetical protein
MAKKQWVHDPDNGGLKIPVAVRRRTENRLRRYAEERFAGRYIRLEIRFRGQFCYVDAYTEPEPSSPDWLPADWPESREEYLERLRSTPTHLCRLRYFGDEERWGFGFYSYASEHYELSMFPTGEFYGLPEDALKVSGEMYLQ